MAGCMYFLLNTSLWACWPSGIAPMIPSIILTLLSAARRRIMVGLLALNCGRCLKTHFWASSTSRLVLAISTKASRISSTVLLASVA